MKRRIFISIFLVALCSMLVTAVSITGIMHNQMAKGENRYIVALEKTLSQEELERLQANPVIEDTTIMRAVKQSIPQFTIVVIVLFVVAGLVAKKLTQRIIQPINEVDLSHPLHTPVYDEFSPLLLKIEKQKRKIRQQIHEMEEAKKETNLLFSKMEEGLILLDKESNILSINQSAIALMGATEQEYIGKNILVFTRHETFMRSVHKAYEGKSKEKIMTLGGKEIQFHTSPIHQTKEPNELEGVLCLLLDVTERQQREKMRREFSANVSHELRTPLTSISGYAELMKNGMVPAEDIPTFAGKIYKESQSLVAMVEDIIKISQLDEGEDFEQLVFQPVDVFQIAKTVEQRLSPFVHEKGLSFVLEGEPVTIDGVPQLLQETLYNLCENAVKYSNKGEIKVLIYPKNEHVCICVMDEGIGIASEHQPFIFERFYREDKSHYKETGGTGLGLSIVKHVVKYHHGDISLQSEQNKGTEITVTLPKKQ